MPSSPPIPSSSASAIQVKTGSGITSKNAQAALVELQSEITNSNAGDIRAAIGLDADYATLNTLVNTNTDARAALNALLGAASNDIITLPEGEFTVLGNGANVNVARLLTVKTGSVVRGSGKGTTIKFRSPGNTVSQFLLDMESNSTLENITLKWDTSTPPTNPSQTNALLFIAHPTTGQFIDNVTLRDVKILGGGQTQNNWLGNAYGLLAWDARYLTMQRVTIKWSMGTAFGAQFNGCEDVRITDCEFSENAADGLKLIGDATYGECKRFFVENTKLNYNGQLHLQGQNVSVGTSITTNTNLTNSSASGSRFILNGSGITVQLPQANTVAAGTRYLFSRIIGSGTVTITRTGADTLTGAGATSNAITWNTAYGDRLLLMFESGTNAWTATQFSNGQGFDGSAVGATFVNCEAIGNETTGFQVKTDTVAQNQCSDIAFIGCTAADSWGGNGFAIVSDTGSGRTPIQNISLTNCTALNNFANGFIANVQVAPDTTRGIISGISLANFTARANKQAGIYLTDLVNDVSGIGIRLYGNGNTTNPAACWNMVLTANQNVELDNVTMYGVDPLTQDLFTEAAIDAATPVCRGLLAIRTASGVNMSRVALRGVTARRHNTADYTYQTTAGVSATAKDLAANLSIDKTPLGMEQWRPNESDANGFSTIIGHPLYCTIDDRTAQNNGIVSGAHSSQPVQIIGDNVGHRWVFGSYDCYIREAISSYIFGSNHDVIGPSASGHSFIAGGACNTIARDAGPESNIIGCQYSTVGRTKAGAYGSSQAACFGNYSTIIGSLQCHVNCDPDTSKLGQITASTVTAGNAQNGQTITVNSTAFGNVNDYVTLVLCSSTGAILSYVPVEFRITAKSSTTTLAVDWPSRATHSQTPNFAVNAYVAVIKGAGDFNSIVDSTLSQVNYLSSYVNIRGGRRAIAKKNPLGSERRAMFADMWGQDVETNCPVQSAGGWGAKPFNPTQMTEAGGFIAAAGDFQWNRSLMLATTTTNATPSQLYTQSAVFDSPIWTQIVYLPENTIWNIRGTITANVGMTDYKCWQFTAVVKSVAFGGIDFGQLTVMSFTPTLVYGTSGASTWDIALFNGGQPYGTTGTAFYDFRVMATGEAGRSIVWRCHLQALEVK